jgi:hypothetical protein
MSPNEAHRKNHAYLGSQLLETTGLNESDTREWLTFRDLNIDVRLPDDHPLRTLATRYNVNLGNTHGGPYFFQVNDFRSAYLQDSLKPLANVVSLDPKAMTLSRPYIHPGIYVANPADYVDAYAMRLKLTLLAQGGRIGNDDLKPLLEDAHEYYQKICTTRERRKAFIEAFMESGSLPLTQEQRVRGLRVLGLTTDVHLYAPKYQDQFPLR